MISFLGTVETARAVWLVSVFVKNIVNVVGD